MIYLIKYDSYNMLNDYIKNIISNENIVTIDYNMSNITNIIEEACTFSLFDDEKTLIVKNLPFFNSNKYKESDYEVFSAYLNNPNERTTMIFPITDRPDARKTIFKLIKDKYNYIEFKPLKRFELFSKLNNYILEQGFSISDKALNYIIDNSNENYDLCINEIKKAFIYYNNPTEIRYNDLLNIISESLNDNNFKFADAVINNKQELALKLWRDLKANKVEPIMLIGLIAKQYRDMLTIRLLKESGMSTSNIAIKLSLDTWKLDKILDTLKSYSLEELKRKLIFLADIDLSFKSGKIDKNMAIEEIIFNN